jgi:trehalose/maltose transport system permease protein
MATTTTTSTQTIARPISGVEPYTQVHKRKIGAYVKRGLFWLLIAFILIYTIFPFYYAILSSLTPSSLLFNTPAVYWPEHLTWEHYEYVFRNDDFLKALMNSAIVSFGITILTLILGSFGAYALGRFRFRGRTIGLYIILSMTMFPAVAILGSLFSVIRGDWFLNTPNLYNTRTALVFTYFTFALPFTVWVLTNFFKAMPGELEEASLVDGATPMQTFFKVLLPLAAPGLVTTGLLCFIAAWNEFLFALTFTQDNKSRTVQVAIASFAGNQQFELPFAKRMAAAVVVTIPLIALVMVFQRKIIAGLTAGAVKG